MSLVPCYQKIIAAKDDSASPSGLTQFTLHRPQLSDNERQPVPCMKLPYQGGKWDPSEPVERRAGVQSIENIPPGAATLETVSQLSRLP